MKLNNENLSKVPFPPDLQSTIDSISTILQILMTPTSDIDLTTYPRESRLGAFLGPDEPKCIKLTPQQIETYTDLCTTTDVEHGLAVLIHHYLPNQNIHLGIGGNKPPFSEKTLTVYELLKLIKQKTQDQGAFSPLIFLSTPSYITKMSQNISSTPDDNKNTNKSATWNKELFTLYEQISEGNQECNTETDPMMYQLCTIANKEKEAVDDKNQQISLYDKKLNGLTKDLEDDPAEMFSQTPNGNIIKHEAMTVQEFTSTILKQYLTQVNINSHRPYDDLVEGFIENNQLFKKLISLNPNQELSSVTRDKLEFIFHLQDQVGNKLILTQNDHNFKTLWTFLTASATVQGTIICGFILKLGYETYKWLQKKLDKQRENESIQQYNNLVRIHHQNQQV